MRSQADTIMAQAGTYERMGDWQTAEQCYRAVIAADAELAAPHLRLSRFAQWRDAYNDSRAHAHNAAKVIQRGKRQRDAGHVSRRLLDFSDYRQAIALIKELDWSRPEVLRQSPVLVQHLWLAGGYDVALECLEKVQGKIANDYRIEYLKGQLARSLGHLDAATQHFEQTIRMQPDFAEGYWMLTQHAGSRSPEQDVAILEDLLKRSQQGGAGRAYLEYARYRRLEESGNWRAAWHALENGSACMREQWPYDAIQESRHIQSLLAHEWLLRPESPAESGSPLFIVGMPRTGTTVLERMLSGHSQVATAGERNDFDAALSEVSDHFHRGGLYEVNIARYDAIDQAKLRRRYRERIGAAPSPIRMTIDKNPQNLFNVGWILRAMPDARVICIRRHPLDTVFSTYRALFEGGAYAYSYDLGATAHHVRHAHALMAHWQEIAPNAVRIVDYEDLVSSPSATARALCGFCGLRYEPAMVEIAANVAPVNTASSSQVREAIHTRTVGAWQQYTEYFEPIRRLLAGIE